MRRLAALGLFVAACDADAGAPDAGHDAAVIADAGHDGGPPSTACAASGLSCEPLTEWCDRGVGRCRGPGRCMARPSACSDPVAEVCGCDGVTYPSACEAARAGASIAAEGPC